MDNLDQYTDNTLVDEECKYENDLLIELIRYINLEREDLKSTDEFDLALNSVWYLLNPMNVPKRDKIDLVYARLVTDDGPAYEQRCRFTSHPHHNEPLRPSPEDILIYRYNSKGNRKNTNIITDRFNLIEIKDWM